MTPLDSASSAVHGLPSRLPGFPSAPVDLAALLEGVLAQNTRLLDLFPDEESEGGAGMREPASKAMEERHD